MDMMVHSKRRGVKL